MEELAGELIYAAERYEVDELKDKCIKELFKNVSEENVVDMLIIADQISGSDKLLNRCVLFVSR
jgi:uncharacterized protein Yka (UPF0111/DUF47 family)